MSTALFFIGLLMGLIIGGLAVSGFMRQQSGRQTDHFRAAAQEALAAQSTQFVQLAEAKYGALHQNTDHVLGHHAEVVGVGLRTLGDRLEALERERVDTSVALRTVVTELATANQQTRAEAAKLSAALRDNRVRGAWGEVQLRRVLEGSGLARHADFIEQSTHSDGETMGRPDVIVPLANGRCVVIDAKAPLDRFLDASAESDDVRERELMMAHARAIASHVQQLAARNYATLVDGSVDLVLLFLPGESFLSAALDADPSLVERSAAKGIHIVTPMSLVPVLRGIAMGWRERQAEAATEEIHQLGVELYERIAIFADHFSTIGSRLESTVKAYNTAVGSMDTRVLSTARRLSERGAQSPRQLADPSEVDLRPRVPRAATEILAVVSPSPSESAPAEIVEGQSAIGESPAPADGEG